MISLNEPLRAVKRRLTKIFQDADLPFPEQDALEIILSATGLERAGLMLRGAEMLTSEQCQIVNAHMDRRLSGEPVDHILGWREFYGRRFHISSDVLSPRADTENLIGGALSRLEDIASPQLLDLGTGSGAIGLTLLAERDDATLIATDVSEPALQIAQANADQLNLRNRGTFRQGVWWNAVPDDAAFHMILSNPPYIAESAMEALDREVRTYDPDIALRGGADGLDAYHLILARAASFLKPAGWLGLEIGFDQGAALRNLLSNGPWASISVAQDLGGLDRVVWAQKIG